MTEAFLIVSNLLFGISILVYIYLKDIRNGSSDQEDKKRMADFFASNATTLISLTESKDQLFQKTFIEYLKHNERLEKMILPQPVTKRAVEEILMQSGPMIPNDIEKNDKDIEKEQLEDLLARIPITKDTNVMFEGGAMPLSQGLGVEEEILNNGLSM